MVGTIKPEPRDKAVSTGIHQMEHFLSGFIRDSAGQLNAAAKSFEFDISPTTL